MNFITTVNKNLPVLRKFVPIVATVHGPDHPEFYEVKEVFSKLDGKLTINETDLSKEFKQLRMITNNYDKPKGVCVSYHNVYNMLEELDIAYEESIKN